MADKIVRDNGEESWAHHVWYLFRLVVVIIWTSSEKSFGITDMFHPREGDDVSILC